MSKGGTRAAGVRRGGAGSARSVQASAPARSTKDHAVEKVVFALLALGVGHVCLYLFLTGDARMGLKELSAKYEVAELEGVKVPDAPPAPGTPAYSPWLRSFERYAAAKDHDMHSRHEWLMRYGMVFSFLIAVSILGAALHRISVARKRGARLAAVPQQVAPVLEHPSRRRYRRTG